MNTEDAPTMDPLDPIAEASFNRKIDRQDYGGPGEEGTSSSDARLAERRSSSGVLEGIRTFRSETRDGKDFSGQTRGRQQKYLAFVNDVGVVEIGVGVDDTGPGCAVTELGLCDGPQRVAVADSVFRSSGRRGERSRHHNL